MNTLPSYHIAISTQTKTYDFSLNPIGPDSRSSVTINGLKYSFVGDKDALTWVQDHISGKNDYKDIGDFKAAILESDAVNHKIQKIAVEQLSSDNAQQPSQLNAMRSPEISKMHQKVEKIDHFIQDEVEKKNFRGIVAIVQDGKLILNKGYGVANESGGEITDRTIFHLGSLTKQFTAASIMLLQQERKLNTQDPITKYLPEKYANNPKWEKITIHQLLNHTSGIPNYVSDDPPKEYNNLDEVIDQFVDADLAFEPGTAWNYSNGGYALLGAIIEHVSKQSYGEFIQNEIFNKLEMTNSGLGRNYSMDNAALGYKMNKSKDALEPVSDQAIHLSKAHAAGGLYSSAGDLLKWYAALDGDSILTEESKKLMFSSEGIPAFKPFPNTNEHPIMNYGYGFFVSDSPSMGKKIEHDAGIFGFSNYIQKFPDKQTTIVMLSNVDDLRTPSLGKAILDMIAP